MTQTLGRPDDELTPMATGTSAPKFLGKVEGQENVWIYTLPETNIAPKNGWLEY